MDEMMILSHDVAGSPLHCVFSYCHFDKNTFSQIHWRPRQQSLHRSDMYEGSLWYRYVHLHQYKTKWF